MNLLEHFEAAGEVVRHLARATTRVYRYWIIEFLQFHRRRTGDWQHPAAMAPRKVEAFLTNLAVNRRVAESTQNQALCALLFLYKLVLEIEIPRIEACRARERRPHATRQFCHSLVGRGRDIRTVQELLGHKDVKTTQIYTYVTQHGASGVRSQSDRLAAKGAT